MTLLYKAHASPREHFLLSPKVSLKSKGANMTILIAPACVFNTYGVPGEQGKATTFCERSLVDLKNIQVLRKKKELHLTERPCEAGACGLFYPLL